MCAVPRLCLPIVVAIVGCSSEVEPARSRVAPDPVETAVRTVISEHLKVEAATIPMDGPITEPPLKADELDLVEIVMELEDRLGIAISDDAIERYAGKPGKGPIKITPNQLVAVVREAPKAQPPKRKK